MQTLFQIPQLIHSNPTQEQTIFILSVAALVLLAVAIVGWVFYADSRIINNRLRSEIKSWEAKQRHTLSEVNNLKVQVKKERAQVKWVYERYAALEEQVTGKKPPPMPDFLTQTTNK